MAQIHKITIEGYKSIQSLKDFELRPLNVLIGANGAGKSNFISLFSFISSSIGDELNSFVSKKGGANSFLSFCGKITKLISIDLNINIKEVGDIHCNISMEPTVDDGFFVYRKFFYNKNECLSADKDRIRDSLRKEIPFFKPYHFHDTSDFAPVKLKHGINDNLRLKPDAANLAAYLRKLKKNPAYEPSYRRIVETIRRAAPFFGDFVFRDDESEYIQLEWTERGNPDTPWKAHVLSDGTLRFICLTTLLLQPESLLPDTVLIDEPELGLHPFAINLLAEMLQEVAETKQVIVSTQSVELVNCFQPKDIIVVERKNEASVFKRLNAEELGDWIKEDYSLGELWKRNILGGRPA